MILDNVGAPTAQRCTRCMHDASCPDGGAHRKLGKLEKLRWTSRSWRQIVLPRRLPQWPSGLRNEAEMATVIRQGALSGIRLCVARLNNARIPWDTPTVPPPAWRPSVASPRPNHRGFHKRAHRDPHSLNRSPRLVVPWMSSPPVSHRWVSVRSVAHARPQRPSLKTSTNPICFSTCVVVRCCASNVMGAGPARRTKRLTYPPN